MLLNRYYNVFCGLLAKQEYLDEEDIPDTNPEEVAHVISQLKASLSEYWML